MKEIKANALAQCKYDEVIALGVELEDSLKVVEDDWKSASRAQIVTAMKSLDKWPSHIIILIGHIESFLLL